MNELIEYFVKNYPFLWGYTLDHLEIVGLATITAILIGVPIGIYLTTNKYLAGTILQLASVFMTIPSIALFGVMIPVLSVINQGVGFLPAFLALVLYSQLPIIRNTYTGIQNVDPQLRDAANGLGMTTLQRLWKVEIPNAMPLIMAGVRTAAVLNIGIGAIAAFIGAGGLGVVIYQGIVRANTTMVLAGAISVAIVAILADFILKLIQKKLTPKGAN